MNGLKKIVLLTFDLEEFDTPCEYGVSISLEEQLYVSTKGTEVLLDLLARYNVKATFFSTAIFAENNSVLIKRIVSEGHELASHGYTHSKFNTGDLLASRKILESLSGKSVQGFRMPRMMPVDNEELISAGYGYNSSINPVWIPGRYNNLNLQRTIHREAGLIHVPASASPLIRFPLFWLSFHIFPLWIYKRAFTSTIERDGYANLYFHPWEFIDLSAQEFSLPRYLHYNTGEKMIRKFTRFLNWMREHQFEFTTVSEYLRTLGSAQE